MHWARYMPKWLKVALAAVLSIFLGWLVNISAAEIDPRFAPHIVRWCWLFVLCGSSAYVVHLSPLRATVSASWHEARGRRRAALLSVALLSVIVFVVCIYASVNTFWDKFGIRRPTASATTNTSPNVNDGGRGSGPAISPHSETPPATRRNATQHAHTQSFLQIEKPDILSAYSTIAPGRQWGGNMHSTNPGPGRLFNVFCFSKAYTVDISEAGRDYDKEVAARFKTDSRDAQRGYRQRTVTGLAELGVGPGPWTTILTDPFTQRECDGMSDGTTTIYFVSWCAWKDSEGQMDTANDCRRLQKLPNPYRKEDIVWHYCER